MALPKYDEFYGPILQLLENAGTVHKHKLEDPLANHFSLGPAEIGAEYKSGNGNIFRDRISWALSYLYIAGLVERPKRAHYAITNAGKEMLASPEKIRTHVTAAAAARDEQRNTPPDEVPESNRQTPQEELYESANSIRAATCQEILDLVLSKTAREFEKLVVELLQRMGYGGEIQGSGEVTQYSNDGGIDGVIREDVLGLGRIHIQAKRYKPGNNIGREAIQSFVGALATAQSNKGVFITTSHFTEHAISYCENLNGATTVVLIDGTRLADLIYEYGPGMQVEQTIVLKRLDSEYWDAMQDEGR